MRHLLAASLGATLCFSGFAVPATAQLPGSIWVEPRVGWSVARGDLGRTDILGNAGSLRFDEIDPGPALGVGAGVTLTSVLAIRGSVDVSPDADATGVWSCAPFVACPSVVLTVEGRVARRTVSVDAILDPGLNLSIVRARIVAGVGLRHYTMTWEDPSLDAFDLPEHRFESTESVLRLGIDLASAVGAGELFASLEASGGRVGGERVLFIEGVVPDGRETRIDFGLLAGVRWPLR